MKVLFVRLSRPVLIRLENDVYQTIYGLGLVDNNDKNIYLGVNSYVGYLSAMHDFSNGGDYFTLTYNCERETTDWVDPKGQVHIGNDAWTEKVCKKCMMKHGISYSTIMLDIDNNTYHDYVGKNHFITDKDVYEWLGQL